MYKFNAHTSKFGRQRQKMAMGPGRLASICLENWAKNGDPIGRQIRTHRSAAARCTYGTSKSKLRFIAGGAVAPF